MANKYCKFVVDSARKNLAPADAYEATKQIFKNHKATKNIKFLKHIMIAIPMYLGCGAIVDYFNIKR